MRLSIRTRIIIGSISIALIAIALAVAGIYGFYSIEGSYRNKSALHTESSVIEDTISRELGEMVIDINGLFARGITVANLQVAKDRYENHKRQANESFDRLEELEDSMGNVAGDVIAEWRNVLNKAFATIEDVYSALEQGESLDVARDVLTEMANFDAQLLTLTSQFLELQNQNYNRTLAELWEKADVYKTIMIITCISLFLIIAVLVLVVFRAISAPIKDLTTAVAEIRRGELGAQIEIKSQDDLGILAASFNEMSTGLKTAREELEQEKGQLLLAKERWDRSFTEVGEGMFIVDKDFTILQCNKALGDLVGEDPRALIGRKCYRVLHGLDGFPDSCLVGKAVSEMKGVSGEVWEPFLKRNIEVAADPVFDSEGNFEYAIHVVRDVTERKRAEEELRTINEELEGFANIVSHDMKGPLSTIGLATCTLRELLKELGEGEGRTDTIEIVDIIERNVDWSGAFIDELLILAKAGQEPGETSPVDVREVVEEILEEKFHEIEEKGIEVDVSGDLGTVTGSPTQIQQVFYNLMNNAIRHNDGENPVVRISQLGDDDDGGHRYLVWDNGPGIPEDIIDRVFLPFVKGDSGDTGIGLSIVEKIIKAYGGEIRVHNDNGACFEFTLRDLR